MRRGVSANKCIRVQRGMALIAVLWMVAALGVIVTGMVHAVRSEVRLVSGARQLVTGAALGDAAIHLVLQEMAAATDKPKRLQSLQVAYQGHDMSVQVQPLNGLIDINNAPQGLLASLYASAGQLGPDVAATLAQATIETRNRKNGVGQAEGFEANEDLLRVPGVNYALYANIADLITASQPGSGRVNPMAAPQAVLAVLAGGNAGQAGSIAASRDAGGVGIDTTSLNSEYTDSAVSQRYRLQAHVLLPDGAVLLVSRSVDLSDDAKGGLPWRTFQTEQRLKPKPGKAP